MQSRMAVFLFCLNLSTIAHDSDRNDTTTAISIVIVLLRSHHDFIDQLICHESGSRSVGNDSSDALCSVHLPHVANDVFNQ